MRTATTYHLLTFLAVTAVSVRYASAQVLPSFGGDRSGTSGFQFLKIPVDPRGSALGHNGVATAVDATALFWNPALAAQTNGVSAAVNHASYFSDVRLEYLAIVYPISRPALTIGVSVQTLNSGDMDVTTEFEPFGTGESFRFVDLAAGLTVSQALTDLFSYGVTAKYVHESSAGVSTKAVLFDIGVFYRIGASRAQMAVAIRNFGTDVDPTGDITRVVVGSPAEVVEDDFEPITPPTSFLLGVAYSIWPEGGTNDLRLSAQLNNPADNAENWNVGAEYIWNQTLILRAGYRIGIEENTLPSVGMGLQFAQFGPQLRFDYGFDRLERLGTVHRIGLSVTR